VHFGRRRPWNDPGAFDDDDDDAGDGEDAEEFRRER
jgi:hypothetical protein